MSILKDILKKRRATRDISIPLVELKSRARDIEPPRDFLRALTKDRLSVIAEIKFQSPSEGVLRKLNDVEAIAASYETAGASALSVLTELHSFGGALENIKRAKHLSSLPVLRKDFLFDEYDIWRSRQIGADAILLIAKMLEREQLLELRQLASDVNLEVLLELHDEDDLQKAEGLSGVAWGVNHRNLTTLQIDLDTSARLFPLLPPRELKVAESGLQSKSDLDQMHKRGANAVLIGSFMMKQPDPGKTLSELLR